MAGNATPKKALVIPVIVLRRFGYGGGLALVGGGFVFAALTARSPNLSPGWQSFLVLADFFAVAACAVLASWSAAGHLRPPIASLPSPLRHLAFTPVLLVIGGFGVFAQLETDWGRYALLTVLLALTAVYLEYAAAMPSLDGKRVPNSDFTNLSMSLHLVALFLCASSVFALSGFGLGRVMSALIIAGFSGAVMLETLWRDGLDPRAYAPLVLAASVVGAELFLGLSFLPTVWQVNGAVAAVLLGLLVQVGRSALAGGSMKILGRQTVAAFAVVGLVLATADWL